jgi:zinc protease
MTMYRRLQHPATVAVCALLIATATLAAGDDLSFPDLPPGAEVLRLENGLQVVLLPNPAQPMAAVLTQVRVGSAYEDFRTSGMSHMLEHLLFNGTATMTQEELYAAADRLGAWNNAHTSDFFTNFIMIVPSAKLAEGVALQAGMLFHSTLPADKFEKERGIVVGELVQARDRDEDPAGGIIREAAFAGSSLALPTLGTLSTIEHLGRDDVDAFYRHHYVPNNMITTVAGGFDRDAVLAMLREHFGVVPPGTVQRPPLTPAPPVDVPDAITRRGGDAHVLALVFEAPGYGAPDYFAFEALTGLLDAPSTGLLARAFAKLPEDRRPDVSSWWDRADGFARLTLRLDLPADADPALYRGLVVDALAAAAKKGFVPADVTEIVRGRTTAALLEREQLRMLAITAAEPLVLGGPDHFLGYLDRLAAVTPDRIARTLERRLVGRPHLAVHVLPGAAAAAGADSAVVEVERSTLAGGAVLVTLRNPVSPLFAAHVAVRNRAVLDGDRPGALNLVHRLLRRGTKDCGRECLERRLAALGAELKLVDDPNIPMDDYYTGGRFSWVRLETAAAVGPEALALALGLLREPVFTAADVADELTDQQATLQRQAGSAGQRARRLFADALYGGHPLSRAPEGAPGTLDGIGLAALQDLHRRAFAPANLVVTVVSPLPHAQVAAMVEAHLPARGEAGPAMPPLPATTQDARVTATAGGPMAAIRTGSLFAVDPADAPALQMLVAVLSDRIEMDLRETRGLSYSTGAGLEIHGGEAALEAWLNPPAARLAEGEQALLETVRGFDAATVTQQELDKARGARAGRLMMRRLASISQAYYLATAELDGRVDGYLSALADHDGVTLDDLVRVGGKYLANRPLVTAVAN